LEANVSDSVAEAEVALLPSPEVSFTDGGDATTGVELAGVDEKGFAGALPAAFEENGFENGFDGVVVLDPFVTPNSDSPILGCGFSSCSTLGLSIFVCVRLLAPFAMRTPRSARILPSFLLHVFLRHVQI
jgi:hypothetical protein